MSGIKKISLSQNISDVLRTRILSGEIAKGEHLTETALADELGVSRGPVREALSALEAEGLIVKLPNGRSEVAGFGMKDIQSYYKLRYLIESEAIKEVLDKPDGEEFNELTDRLTDILEESRQYMTVDDTNFTQLDNEFHLTILKDTDQKVYIRIWMLLKNLNDSIMELNRKFIREEQLHDAEKTYSYHDRILKGLKLRDLNYTLQQLDAHFENGARTYSSIIDRVSKQHKSMAE